MTLKQFFYCLLLSCLLLSFTAADVVAQATTTNATASQGQKTSEHQELEKKALALLNEIAGGADTLRLAENRALVRASVADILWTHDEKRARALFKDAISDLIETASATTDDADDASGFGYMSKQTTAQLRGEVLQIIAAHDARLALEYLRATRPAESSAASLARKRYGQYDPEPQLELTLAAQMVASDPQRALEAAEESLARGVSTQLPDIVGKLQKKDPDAAAKLVTDIIKKLRAENLKPESESVGVAISLLKMQSGEGKDAAPILNKQAAHDLANMLATAALNVPSGKSYYMSRFDSALPEIEKYAPARAAEVRRKIAAFKKRNMAASDEDEGNNQSETTSVETNYQQAMEKGNADDVLALAAKAEPEMRSQMIQQAASKALAEGNAERARQIINDKITDPLERKQMLAELDRQVLARAVEKGKIEEARQIIARVRSNDERATALAALAITAKEKEQPKLALQLLDEARSAISPRARNVTQLAAQFQVARALTLVDPARSFVIVEPMIDQVNELVNAAAVLGSFIAPEFMRDDEAMMSLASRPIAMLSAQFNRELAALVNADFERTKATADRFQRNELRILARLLIARNVLVPPSPEEDKTNTVPANTTIVMDQH